MKRAHGKKGTKSVKKSKTVSTQTHGGINLNNPIMYNSVLSYGSETEEDIDLCDVKPKITEIFVKLETEISESLLSKTVVPGCNLPRDLFTRVPRVVLTRCDMPKKIPKTEPVSDEELPTMSNILLPQEIKIDLIASNISEDNTNENGKKVPDENVPVPNAEYSISEELIRNRRKMKKKHLTISQMHKIVQNDNGFFRNKKKWMTKTTLRKLPDKDKIFLSYILKKFIKGSKIKVKNKK